MQQGGNGDLFLCGVDVEHAVESGCEDGLDIEEDDLGLEGGDAVDGALGRAQHVAGEDVLLLDAAEADADLVAAGGAGDLCGEPPDVRSAVLGMALGLLVAGPRWLRASSSRVRAPSSRAACTSSTA